MSASDPPVAPVGNVAGHATIHKAFGGAGVASRNTPRQNAHAAAMKASPAKCRHDAGIDDALHSEACDTATGLLEKLREVLG